MATVRIQMRRGTAAEWTSVDPILAAGEMGLETDTGDFKFGDGSSTWSQLNYALGDSVDDYIPLSEKGVADGVATLDSNGLVPVSQLPGAAALDAEVQSAISDHNSDTTNVHGIANTALLATMAYADQAEADAISSASSDATSKANAAQAAAEATAAAALSSHASDTTGIHGIADTSILVTTTGTQTLTNKTITAPSGLVKSDVGLGNVDNTSDINKPVSTAQAAADAAAQAAAEATAAAALSSHESDTTGVHGIADTSLLVTTTGTQTLLSKTLSSPSLTGTPTAPTAANGTDTTQIATTEFVQNAIETVIGAAPEALNTLAEIATSLNDDADLAGTLTASIAEKVAKAGDTMSGVLSMGDNKITNLSTPTASTDAAHKGYVDGAVANNVGSHNSDTTNVHGISDTTALIYDTDPRLSDVREPADGSVITAKIADQSVTTAKINDSSVTTAKLADDAVTEIKIVDDAITTHKILDAAVLEAKIADLNITTAKLADGAVTTAKIPDSNITTAKIADDAVTTIKIVDDAVVTDKIADLNITDSKLADSAVTTAKIMDSAVTTIKIADAAVNEGKILDDAVTTAKIANSNVTTAKLANGAVTEDKLASDAVSTVKILNSNVTTAKLANGAVTEDKLGLLSVTSGKIADGAVTSAKIADGTIVDADINASAAIAQSKISGLTSDLAAKALDADLDSHTGATTSVHGIADTASLVTLSGSQTLTGKTLSAADNTITINAADIVDVTASAAELNILDGVTATAAELNILDGVTATAAEINVLDGITTSTTELNYVDGVTSSIQTQIDAKAPSASPTFTGTVVLPSTTSVGNVTSTELGYLDGVTSAIQTQIDAKAPSASPTFTGTVTVAASGVAFTDGTQTKAGVPSLTTIGTTIGAAYNLSTGGLSLRDQLIPVSGTYAITVPTNATTAFPVGTSISFYQSAGTGANFVEASGVTILRTPGLKLRTTYSSATITKVATDTWLLAGDLSA